MPRPRKVRLVKGENRIVVRDGRLTIDNTYFCGECGRRVKLASIQKPYEPIARVCVNVEEHKDGKKYFWPLKEVTIII